MLSYPLCPFFVVFCNVVGTSDPRDFQLLQDVTDGISTLVTENKYVNRLHRLCETLLSLCRPLVPTSGPTGQIGAFNAGLAPALAAYPSPSLAFNNGPELLNDNNMGDTTDGMMPSSWNDDMMWQLFQSQPSLDWFNADILNNNAWDIGQSK
jgi:hypothetical protein